MYRSHAYMKLASDSTITTLVGISRAQLSDADFWSSLNRNRARLWPVQRPLQRHLATALFEDRAAIRPIAEVV